MVKKNDIEVTIKLGSRCLSVQNLVESVDNQVKVPLSTQISEDKITFIAKAPQLDENIGSVSIPQYIILNGGLNTYEQWITLFEHEEDDEYDGEMGANDDEEPRLLIKFQIAQDVKTTKQTLISTMQITEKELKENLPTPPAAYEDTNGVADNFKKDPAASAAY